MKRIFRSLTFVTALAAAAAARGQATGDREQGTAISGQKLVEDAAKRVAREPAISAEMRYKIDAFGHELVGTGSYLQFGAGPEKLVRLDLRMQVGEKPATVQEIRGEDSYWVRRDMPPSPPTLGRVDLKQLRKLLAQSSNESGGEVLPQGDWIMLGGLARLITALEQNFAFGTPRAEELRFNSANGKSIVKLPIWIVEGHWKPKRLTALVGRESGKLGVLPEQLPDRVELVLGRTDDVLPLFPYRITYWRTSTADSKAAQGSATAPPRELLTLELFSVSRKPIDLREFEYQPGDQDVQNLTQVYVQRLGGERKLR